MLQNVDNIHIISLFAAGAAVFTAEAIYLLFFSGRSYRNTINHRLRISNGEMGRESILLQLRRERGLDDAGNYLLPIKALNRLIMQSGMRFELSRMGIFVAVLAGLGFVAAMVGTGEPLIAAGAAITTGLGLPLVVLTVMRARRQRLFGDQFPDAIDVIVRSLKAGHPVPVAISMVAREMPDPIGTEFGIVADEVTYGADLETAMRSLQIRVGQPDLHLFVTSISIQSTTGGNLREILQNLSTLVRDRIKMRRKIKSVSSEGRSSAMILSALPILFFAGIQMFAPHFYGTIWHTDIVQYGLTAAGVWMLVGIAIMYRMTKFKI